MVTPRRQTEYGVEVVVVSLYRSA